MKRKRSGYEEDDKEEEEPRDASMLPSHIPGCHWRDIARNAKLTEAETLTFFSEFKRAGELTDEDVIERCNFLMRHAPPSSYLTLKIKGKFVQLIKRLERVCDCYLSPFVEPRSLMTCLTISLGRPARALPQS